MRTLSPADRATLATETAAVRAELARSDGKASTLVGLNGAGLVYAATSAASAAPTQAFLLLAASAALGFSAIVSLGALRPKLGLTGLCLWSTLTLGGVLDALAGAYDDEHAAHELVVLSTIAVSKFRSIQRAVDALKVGVVVLAGAVLAGVVL